MPDATTASRLAAAVEFCLPNDGYFRKLPVADFAASDRSTLELAVRRTLRVRDSLTCAVVPGMPEANGCIRKRRTGTADPEATVSVAESRCSTTYRRQRRAG
jgi:hypothetical protein